MASNTTDVTYTSTSEGGLDPALIIAAGAVLPPLGIIAVALRFYSRLKSKNVGVGADDWLILSAIFWTTGLGIMMIVGGAIHALATPTELLPGKTSFLTFAGHALLTTEKIFYTFNIIQCLAFGSAKLSVLFFYRRIFRGLAFDIVSIFMVVIVCIWTAGFFFAMIFRCGTEPHWNWSPLKDLLTHCYKSTPMFQAFSISDVITDVLIIVIPIYWVSKLHLRLAKKLAVCGIFMLGFLAIAAGITRLVFFIQQSRNYNQNADGIGHLTTEMYWSMIEMGISVIAACLPTIRLLFGGVTVQSVITSVRSTLSLHSQTFGGRSSNKDRENSRVTTGTNGTSDQPDKFENIKLTEITGKQSQGSHADSAWSEHGSQV